MRAINMQMDVFKSAGRGENIFTSEDIKVEEKRPPRVFQLTDTKTDTGFSPSDKLHVTSLKLVKMDVFTPTPLLKGPHQGCQTTGKTPLPSLC